jgi:hypothetical protein
MDNQEIQGTIENTWTFARTDFEGTTSTRTFEASTWPMALQQFVNFLKQDFSLDSDSIAINGDKHLPSCDCETDAGWYGALYYPDSEQPSKSSGY